MKYNIININTLIIVKIIYININKNTMNTMNTANTPETIVSTDTTNESKNKYELYNVCARRYTFVRDNTEQETYKSLIINDRWIRNEETSNENTCDENTHSMYHTGGAKGLNKNRYTQRKIYHATNHETKRALKHETNRALNRRVITQETKHEETKHSDMKNIIFEQRRARSFRIKTTICDELYTFVPFHTVDNTYKNKLINGTERVNLSTYMMYIVKDLLELINNINLYVICPVYTHTHGIRGIIDTTNINTRGTITRIKDVQVGITGKCLRFENGEIETAIMGAKREIEEEIGLHINEEVFNKFEHVTRSNRSTVHRFTCNLDETNHTNVRPLIRDETIGSNGSDTSTEVITLLYGSENNLIEIMNRVDNRRNSSNPDIDLVGVLILPINQLITKFDQMIEQEQRNRATMRHYHALKTPR